LNALTRLRTRRPNSVEFFLNAWRLAEKRAALALASWQSAPATLKGEAYAAYVAALDHEAQAAEVLRMAVA
jgi:hypothetical protein